MRASGIVAGMMCAALIGGSAGNAWAQSAASSLGELTQRNVTGRTVYVTDDSGRKVKGKLVDLSATSLTLLNGRDRETFEEAKVVQLTELRRETGKRALAGLGIGAMGGAVVALLSCGDCGEYAAPLAMAAAVLGGGIGAGVGAAVGAARPHERVLFRAPRATAATRVSVAPIISNRGTGAAVSLRF